MAKVTVQFTDDEQTSVVTIFGCAQDPSVFRHLGEIDADDRRYIAYLESLPQHIRSTLPSEYEGAES